MSIHKCLLAGLTAVTLTACGGSDAASAGEAGGQASAETSALKPNERLQGTIELDIGKGPVAYRSIATKLADDLGKTAAQHLESAEGQRRLDDANARLKGDVKVQASDVQAFADSVAGKTIYTSELRDIELIRRRNVSIRGISAEGAAAALVLTFPMDGGALESAVLEYAPDRRKTMQTFTTGDELPVDVTIERFERIDEDTWSIAGRFTAAKLEPGVLAKQLAGQSITGASGRFDIAELRVRPKI